MNVALIPVFIVLGTAVGFMAGLFGIGGGFTIVPVLVEVFTREGVAVRHVLPLAIGTSAATIVFTTFASARAHHAHGAVDWSIVKAMTPGLVVGSLIGPQIASALSFTVMAAVFATFMWLTAYRMVRSRPPMATRTLPGAAAMSAVGAGIGTLAGLVGTGGAFLAVPFLTRCNVKLHTAVASSAALGVPIAIAATAGYVIAGWRREGLPPYTLGYVYLPALVAIVVSSMLLAPVGARVAHAWPVQRLRNAFAGLLFVLGGFMWWKGFAT